MLIGGEWMQAASGDTLPVYDPATAAAIGIMPAGDSGDVDTAVSAAREALERRVWLDLAPPQRAKIMWRVAELIDLHAEELAGLETLNCGMPLSLARTTVQGAAEVFRYYAGWCTKIYGLTTDISAGSVQFHAYTSKEPVGVVGLICPWNAPLAMAAKKVATALAAGCTCVLKPAEETPLTTLRFGELLQQSGVPDGVVNIVTGLGHTVGAALCAHPGVAKIAFTGSTEVGKLIVQAAAGNLKKVALELGGKSPVLIFEDAPLESAIAAATNGVFLNSGQVCIAGSRVYVQRGAYDEVVTGIADAARRLRIGNGFDTGTQLGPLISARQLDRVCDLVERGIDAGAELITGGGRLRRDGHFMEPTILANAGPDSCVTREEIFGPVLSINRFDDLDAAVHAANDTTYGLAAAVWTSNLSRAHLLARQLTAGTVWINCQLTLNHALPMGGYKQSGWGREYGLEGLEEFLETKAVFTRL
ncbi:MAG: NAD-dependent aldehyde dehydrogenase [Gammaproteobacteria bacterium]|nr:NAD-dependent aldehyde dehydrogenase [Gammaproteobacteria bacterium]